MIGVSLALIRAGGWPRMVLLATCTAVVSGLLLVVVAILRLPAEPTESLFALVYEPGLRGGTAFGTAMLCVPALLLLHQAVRLGTAARERRLASLRLAGATPGDVRAIGAIEVTVPAFVGSVAGIGVYGLLRVLFGGSAAYVRLVPTTVAPSGWQVGLVVLGVTGLGLAVGLFASRRMVVTPLGVTRRQAPPPPRPWGALLMLAALGGAVLSTFTTRMSRQVDQLIILAMVTLAVLGIVSLAPWFAYRAGRFVLGRTASPTTTLAAGRVVAEPRAVGRAAAAVGGIALVAGGAGAHLDDVVRPADSDTFFRVSYLLVALLLLTALLLVVGTLVVHSVESLLDRKRSIAALAALGTSPRELERVQFAEIALASMPVAAAGALIGSVAMGVPTLTSPLSIALPLVTIAVVLGLLWLAAELAVRATRPWVRRATAVDNLRTP
ncbi:FtsX-like permease family protein [Virgisporangium aurantiacum]|uniref:ABC3 transporter permease C-terminal domain-containing protein n=1 Tax=Virgisporangium aurantiacum TaxID=175570 RepID=A0A8J4E583_9ACTN|nr:FtsX-like permease family protein [Virgisporangium aurantiacum]GIJ61828.1 hypothetical protein Vau01_093440 [Virgisporangium aurantiacum]